MLRLCFMSLYATVLSGLPEALMHLMGVLNTVAMAAAALPLASQSLGICDRVPQSPAPSDVQAKVLLDHLEGMLSNEAVEVVAAQFLGSFQGFEP